MKKLFTYILISLTFLPLTVSANFAVTMQATSTSQGWVFPGRINSSFPSIVSPYYISTSTTATSTFPNIDITTSSKEALVVLLKPNGTKYMYRPSAETAAARGTALINAQTASASGDIIYIAPATYTTASSIGKDGVNYFFYPGAIVSNSTTVPIADGGAALSFRIDGAGEFITSDAHGVQLTGGGAVFIRGKKISAAGTSKGGVSLGGSSSLHIEMAESIVSASYDGLYTESDNVVYIRTPLLQGDDSGLALEGEAESIRADIGKIVGGNLNIGSSALQISSGDYTMDISVNEIVAGGNNRAITNMSLGTVRANTITGLVDIGGVSPRIIGATIDSTASTTGSTVTINTGGAPVLDNVTIISGSSATYSVTSGAARTVTIQGSLTYNKDIHTNVTFTNGSGLAVKSTNGNVGVGTTSPYAKLAIQGNADIRQLVVKGNASQTNNLQEWQSSTGGLLSRVNGNGRFISAASADNGYFFDFGTNGLSWDANEGMFWNSSASAIFQIDNDTNSSTETFSVYTGSETVKGGTKLFEIDSSGNTYVLGNVGIGTTSPYAKLSVVGEVVGRNFTATTTTTNTFPHTSITKLVNLTSNGFVKTSGGDGTLSVDTNTYLTTANAATTYVPYTGASADVDLGSHALISTGLQSDTLYNNAGTYTAFNLSNANLNDLSNVASIDLDNRTLFDSTGAVSFDWNASNNAFFNTKVGIGTSSPYAKLSVVGEVVASHFTATTTATSTFAGVFSVGSSTPSNIMGFSVGSSTPTALTQLKSSGWWGIGSTTPTKLFSVQGETWASATSTSAGLNVLAPTTGTSTAYLYSKTALFGGEVILEDVDGAGCTKISTLNGVISGTIVTCPTEI